MPDYERAAAGVTANGYNRNVRDGSYASLGHRRSAAAVVLCTALVVTVPVFAQGGRTLAEWQRDLRDPAVDVRVRAAQELGGFDRRAVPALTGALGDKEYSVRAAAVAALLKMRPTDVVPTMVEALQSAEVSVRANAAGVLGSFGTAAMPAVPALARALKDANPRVRELAGEALNRIAAAGSNQPSTLSFDCH